MMTLRMFGDKMKDKIAEVMGEKYEVKLETVIKNNDTEMLGIRVTARNRNISPTIYLDIFYREYIDGKAIAEIAEEMVSALRHGMPKRKLDLSFFTDFEIVKQKICYKLISAERNSRLLKKIPYIPLLDLAICFYYPIENEEIGKGSILIHNSHLELWHASVQDLWKAADHNTSRLYPAECFSMERIMMEMVGLRSPEERTGELPEENGLPMYVITNRERLYGAAVILYDHYLERIAEALKSSFYLMPCSIHEVILLPKRRGDDSERLREIVEEVNDVQVESQEVLSDSVYYFDRKKKRLCLLSGEQRREEAFSEEADNRNI